MEIRKFADNNWYVGWNASTDTRVVVAAAGTFNAGDTFSAAVTWSAAGSAFYTKGIQRGTNGSAPSTGATAGASLNVNAGGSFCTNTGDAIYYSIVWNRVLQPQELQLIAFDPFCFLAPTETEMPALSTGAAPTPTGPWQAWADLPRKTVVTAALAAQVLAFVPIPPSVSLIPDWPDFTRRLPVTPAPSTAFVPVVTTVPAPNMGWARWPDFATKKPAPLNFNPLALVIRPPQVWFPHAPWDDFVRRKPQPLDTQPLARSTFTPVTTQVWFPHAPWDDFTRAAKRTAEFPAQAFTALTPSVSLIPDWPDFFKRPPVTLAPPSAFVPVVSAVTTQVWFSFPPWDDFARRARLPTDPQSFAFMPLVPSGATSDDWPDFFKRTPTTQPAASSFVPVVAAAPAPNMGWVQWPDFAPKKLAPLNFNPLVQVQLAPQVWFPHDNWPDRIYSKFAQRDTQPLAEAVNFTEITLVSKWFDSLSEPVRFKAGLAAYLQSSYTNDTIAETIKKIARLVPWYAPWREPVRVKPLLRTAANPAGVFSPFPIPNNFVTARLDVTEQGDLFSGAISQRPLLVIRCYVSIIENTAAPSIMVSIPVTVAPSARVTIRDLGPGIWL